MYVSKLPSVVKFPDYYGFLNAELIFQFCFSIIAFAALTIEQLSQGQKFIRLVVAALLSLVQFILTMIAQIKLINYVNKVPKDPVYPYEYY